MNITIEVPNLTAEECGDVAITAAEGGIGYWSVIDSYDWRRWQQLDGSTIREVADDFVFYVLEWEGRQPAEEKIKVTPALIRAGVERAFAEPGTASEGWGWQIRRLAGIARKDWTCEIDSDAADVIIQLGAFGEVVFG